MLDLVLEKINKKYPFANVSAFEAKHNIELETIRIPEEKQSSGVGSDIIRMLQDYAKEVGKPIVIRPSADKGKKEALIRFYKKLGFVKNSGRNMDYTLSSPMASTMYWRESFKSWLENIEVPPHLPELFWDDIYKKAIELESKFVPANEIDKLEKWLSDEESFETRLDYDVRFIYRILQNDYGVRLSERIKSLKESEELKLGRSHVRKSIENLDFMNDELFKSGYKNYIDSYTNFFRTKKHSPNADTRTKPHEMSEEGRKKYKTLKSIYDAIFDYTKLIKKASLKARAMLDTYDRGVISSDQQYSANRKQGRVPSDSSSFISSDKIRDFEILYHATPFIKEILSQGFKTKEELGNVNMLGGDTSGGISFTADLKIADEIAKCLKEVILIAQGKIKATDIIRMVKADRNFRHPSSDDRLWPLDDFISTAKRNKFIKDKERDDPDYVQKMRDNDFYKSNYETKELSSPEQVFEIYKRYLSFSRKRYNPVFFMADIKSFTRLDVNNTGVLASRVDMSKTIEYLHSMEEYRVPKEAILKTWRVRS